jgi:hypothetical protein
MLSFHCQTQSQLCRADGISAAIAASVALANVLMSHLPPAPCGAALCGYYAVDRAAVPVGRHRLRRNAAVLLPPGGPLRRVVDKSRRRRPPGALRSPASRASVREGRGTAERDNWPLRRLDFSEIGLSLSRPLLVRMEAKGQERTKLRTPNQVIGGGWLNCVPIQPRSC